MHDSQRADALPTGAGALLTLAQTAPSPSPPRRPSKTATTGCGRRAFGSVWLQVALLEQGLARVAIAPDRNECAPDFYEAEAARPRQAGAGIWALCRAYRGSAAPRRR